MTAILRRKGRAQDALADSLAALRRRSGAEDQSLLDVLSNTTSQLAKLILNGPQHGMTPTEYQNKIKALEEQREKLEAEVSRRSAGFYERARPVTLAAVQGVVAAFERVRRPLDRDRQVLLAAQSLHVRLKAAEHRVATLVSRGSGPARVLDVACGTGIVARTAREVTTSPSAQYCSRGTP